MLQHNVCTPDFITYEFEKIKESVTNFLNSNINFRWWILSGIIITFILILYINLAPVKHTYNPGDIADKDIKAPEDFFVEDEDATEMNRKSAIKQGSDRI